MAREGHAAGPERRHQGSSRELANDAQLKFRFEREAKTISQLEHPHICRLYDVGEAVLSGGADGFVGTAPPEGGAAARRIAGEAAGAPPSYLVMELLEGEALADRIARGPRPRSTRRIARVWFTAT